MAKKKGKKTASGIAAPSYATLKAEAIEILDENTDLALAANYGAQYNAKTALFKVLGIGPERMWAMAPTVNKHLRKYPRFRPVTSAAMASCGKVAEFIVLYSEGANVAVPKGEPT